MHNGFLNVDNEKMSKSLGNFFTIRDVLKRYDGETLRFFMLRTHYRSPFNFSDAQPRRRAQRAAPAVHRARRRATCRRRAGRLGRSRRPRAFRAAMNDDFNTPVAVAVLFELAGEVNRTRSPQTAALLQGRWARTLGVLQQAPRSYLQGGSDARRGRASQAHRRARGRPRRHATSPRPTASATSWPAQGVVLKDSPQGTTWVKA